MKKLLFAIALVLMTVSAMAYVTMTSETYNKTWVPPREYEANTEYYEFRFLMYTPYGVVLKDGEGNVILDEKNSPVIVFNDVVIQWRAVLRVQNYRGNNKFEWAILRIAENEEVPADGTGGLAWKEAKGVEMVNVVMESGDCRAYIKVPFMSPERGEGLGKASCLATGSCFMEVNHGKMVITNGSGSFTGYGLDESRALGMAEPATPLCPTPIDSLSVHGSFSVFRRGGEMNYKAVRSVLNVKTSVKTVRK